MRLSQKHYYDFPTQVAFRDDDCDETGVEGSRWLSGIAYKDEIICGCCGGVYSIYDVHDLIEFKQWNDISTDDCICYESWFDDLDKILEEMKK